MRIVLTLSVLMLAAGCGRTPLNGTPGLLPDDGGVKMDASVMDGAKHDGPWSDAGQIDAPVQPDGARPDGPRPDGPRPDGPRPDGPRPDGPRPDGGQRDAQFDSGQADGSTPGVVECGNTTCNVATEECCVTWQGTASCIARGAPCQGSVATCDGPEDCGGSTPICCGRNNGQNRGLRCTSVNGCNGERVCHLDADCATGQRCCVEATIAGYTVLTCAAAADCPYFGPGVVCGPNICTTSQVCCMNIGGSSCTAANACSGRPIRCDGPEDCGGGTPVCCGDLTTGTSCVAANNCSGTTSRVVCHLSTDCPSGQTCTDLGYGDLRVCF